LKGVAARSLGISEKTIAARMASWPKAAQASGLIAKCLAIRQRLLTRAGQAPAEAQVNGVLAKCKAMAARMGASPRTSAGLDEETYQ
jgi:hypothetical protein